MDYLGDSGVLTNIDDLAYVISEVTKGLNCIQSLGICHGDLKLSSVLLHNTGLRPTIKLSDFGTIGIYGKNEFLKQSFPAASFPFTDKFPYSKWTVSYIFLAFFSLGST